MKTTVWILTEEHNEYDQYGEYFIAVFGRKPTHEELSAHGVRQCRLRHTLNGGGRVDNEDAWFYLREYKVEQ